jgi:Ser/Thr protein kinase RdoA (MazF antagonist)
MPNGPEPVPGWEWLLPLDAPEGERYAVLFTYARGRSLKRAKDPALFHAFGRITAHMHLAADVLPHSLARVPLDSYSLLARPLEIIGQAYPERAEAVEELREAARLAQQVFEQLPPAAWGFCHGDLNFSNAHVNLEGEFTLFHFEYCGPGWPAYDIATLMNFESRDAAHLFLEGYEEVRPLSAQERSALGWFQIANNLWILGTAASMSSVFGSLLTSSLLFDQTLEFVRERIESLIQG